MSWVLAQRAVKPPLLVGIALLGALWGTAVALVAVNALYLCVALIGCAFILLDFRIGVVLLVLLMPISSSTIFPHEMLGVVGLNPLNLLLVGTLASYLLHAASDGSLRRFLPQPLVWLYVVPIVAAGALGSRHVGDIASGYVVYDLLSFDSPVGYLRDEVLKPLFSVLYAVLVAAAVEKSAKPEKFFVPALVSIWIMGATVIVFVVQSGVGLGELASDTSRGFLSPLGMHANDLGRLYAVAYALLLFTFAETRAIRLKLALLASMAVVVVALGLTFSRGAFLGFVVVNVLFLLWRRDAKALIFFGLLAAVALFFLPGAVYERLESGLEAAWTPRACSTPSARGASRASGRLSFPMCCAARSTGAASGPSCGQTRCARDSA